MEELMSCAAGGGAEFVERTTFDLGHRVRDLLYVARFTSFSTIGNGRKEWTIRLEHKLTQGRGGHRVAHILSILEGDDSGEAYDGAGGADTFEVR